MDKAQLLKQADELARQMNAKIEYEFAEIVRMQWGGRAKKSAFATSLRHLIVFASEVCDIANTIEALPLPPFFVEQSLSWAELERINED